MCLPFVLRLVSCPQSDVTRLSGCRKLDPVQPEPDIYAWITGDRPVPPEHDTALFGKLRTFARGEAK